MKLLKRILVGILLIAVVVAAIFLHPLFLTALVAVWIFLATLEYTKLLDKQNVHLPLLLLPLVKPVLPLVAVILLLRLHRTVSAFLCSAVLLVLGLVWVYALFAAAPRGPKLAFASFGVLYLGLLPVHLLLLRQYTMSSRSAHSSSCFRCY